MTVSEQGSNVSPGVVRWCAVLTALGVAAFAFGCWQAPTRAWASLLQISVLFVQLGLGGGLFLALHHLTGAKWSRPLLAVPAVLTTLLPVGGLGVLLVLVAYPGLYPWSAHEAEHHASAWFREDWLWWPGVVGRAILFLALWLALLRPLTRGLLGGTAPARPGAWAALFVVVFAITCWLSSVDWIMSLDGEWSSTVFGVYHFASLYLATLAASIVLLAWLRPQTPLRNTISEEHFHDLGKLLFGFSSFWGYIWFCQYMLIWYVNNPEETSYYVRRLSGGWGPLFLLNLALGWIVPFLVLMSRAAKRDVGVLVKVSLAVLLGRVLDLYVLVQPAIEEGPVVGVPEIGITIGGISLGLLILFRTLESRDWLGRAESPRLSVEAAVNGETASTGQRAAGWILAGTNPAARQGAVAPTHSSGGSP